LRYVSPQGKDDPDFNFNGAEDAIAGLASRAGNVFALMPHPERAMEDVLGSADGRLLLEGVLRSLERAA
jgi:phosphoribosylformylglycinamidine synthase